MSTDCNQANDLMNPGGQRSNNEVFYHIDSDRNYQFDMGSNQNYQNNFQSGDFAQQCSSGFQGNFNQNQNTNFYNQSNHLYDENQALQPQRNMNADDGNFPPDNVSAKNVSLSSNVKSEKNESSSTNFIWHYDINSMKQKQVDSASLKRSRSSENIETKENVFESKDRSTELRNIDSEAQPPSKFRRYFEVIKEELGINKIPEPPKISECIVSTEARHDIKLNDSREKKFTIPDTLSNETLKFCKENIREPTKSDQADVPMVSRYFGPSRDELESQQNLAYRKIDNFSISINQNNEARTINIDREQEERHNRDPRLYNDYDDTSNSRRLFGDERTIMSLSDRFASQNVAANFQDSNRMERFPDTMPCHENQRNYFNSREMSAEREFRDNLDRGGNNFPLNQQQDRFRERDLLYDRDNYVPQIVRRIDNWEREPNRQEFRQSRSPITHSEFIYQNERDNYPNRDEEIDIVQNELRFRENFSKEGSFNSTRHRSRERDQRDQYRFESSENLRNLDYERRVTPDRFRDFRSRERSDRNRREELSFSRRANEMSRGHESSRHRENRSRERSNNSNRRRETDKNRGRDRRELEPNEAMLLRRETARFRENISKERSHRRSTDRLSAHRFDSDNSSNIRERREERKRHGDSTFHRENSTERNFKICDNSNMIPQEIIYYENGELVSNTKLKSVNDLKLGSWNVRSRPIDSFVSTLEGMNINLIALQEMIWSFKDAAECKDYSVYYSSSKTGSFSFGSGFLVDLKSNERVIEFVPVNERLCVLRLKGKSHNYSIINVSIPREVERVRRDEKDRFFDILSDLCKKCPKDDCRIIMGNFNAKIGPEIRLPTVGKHSAHSRSNENGKRLIDFAERRKFTIGGTIFPHKEVHKYTWVSPDGETSSQIDHVLFDSNYYNDLLDVRSFRGPNIDSDHYLIVSRIRCYCNLTCEDENDEIKRILEDADPRDVWFDYECARKVYQKDMAARRLNIRKTLPHETEYLAIKEELKLLLRQKENEYKRIMIEVSRRRDEEYDGTFFSDTF